MEGAGVNSENGEFLTVNDVAKVGDASAATVRLWADSGKLPVIRTASGMRLFRRADVERLLAERRSRAAG
jgi:excisionase family DNA binding protein